MDNLFEKIKQSKESHVMPSEYSSAELLLELEKCIIKESWQDMYDNIITSVIVDIENIENTYIDLLTAMIQYTVKDDERFNEKYMYYFEMKKDKYSILQDIIDYSLKIIVSYDIDTALKEFVVKTCDFKDIFEKSIYGAFYNEKEISDIFINDYKEIYDQWNFNTLSDHFFIEKFLEKGE